MGAYGGLCIFDHTQFVQTIVPAMQAGEADPLVAKAIGWLNTRHSMKSVDFANLAHVTAHCNAEMTSNALHDFCVVNGMVHAPSDNYSGQRQDDPSFWNYEELNQLFETLLTAYCVTAFANFGLRKHSLRFDLFYDYLQWDALFYDLITLLDSRSQYWAHGSGGYAEGIHGWLSVEETELLLLGMPDAAEFDPGRPYETEFAWSLQQAVEFGRIRNLETWLQFIDWFRRIATRAVAQQQGLLWGRDLHIFYDDGSSSYLKAEALWYEKDSEQQ